MKLDRLILIHKTHLDIGFTDLASNVFTQYLEHFIPAAIARAKDMNEDKEVPEFIWTTGAWIIWKALQCGGPDFRKELESAIRKGWITWHALPFTFHTELLNPALMKLSLKFSEDLDSRFGRRTVSAKMTDVPGHTIGLVPLLADAGIEFLHIGVNPGSRVPSVPSVFRWQCNQREITVAYSGTYGDVSSVPGLSTGLTFLHTSDNIGPPQKEDILEHSAWLKARYGSKSVEAGTLDEFALLLRDHREALPTISNEIGDSWIHGVGSDPQKVSDYCAIRRGMEDRVEEWMAQPLHEIVEWLEPLLLIPEHTWGMDAKVWFGDHAMLGSKDLALLGLSKRVRQMESAWDEQRAYVETVMEKKPDFRDVVSSKRALRQLPVLESPVPFSVKRPLVAGRWVVRFEPQTGCLSEVYDQQTQEVLSPSDGRMHWGLLRYEHFGTQDYREFLDYYMGEAPRPWWTDEDFKKWNLAVERRESATLGCGPTELEVGSDSTKVLIRPQFFAEPKLIDGCPEDSWMLWTFSHESPRIELSVGWSRKAAITHPEALWLGFRMPVKIEHCRVRKLGQWIDPQSCITGGAQSLHAIEDQVRLQISKGHQLVVKSEDAPLFSLGDGQLLPGHSLPAAGNVLWFNLFNNVWNTNFRLWNEGAMAYHFVFEMETGECDQ